VGLHRPDLGTHASVAAWLFEARRAVLPFTCVVTRLECQAQQSFRESACVNGDGFIFSSSKKQSADWLDSTSLVSARLIVFALKSRCKTMSRQGDELFLACVVKDSRSRFALVEIGPPLRHVIFVIERQRYTSVVPVVWCLHSRYSF
jgi:hypothetical protein